MIELEVRCCCQPQKLLGYLPVRELRPGQGSVSFRWYEDMRFSTMADAFNGVATSRARFVNLPVAEIHGAGEPHIAIKAEGMELEELRKIPGFREAA